MLEFEDIKTFFYLHKKIITVLVIFIVGLSVILLRPKTDEVIYENTEKEELKEVKNEEKRIFVDVKGEVKNAGVYEMKASDRVIDALKKAGLTKQSSTEYINLSKTVTDEMVIVVYSKEEVKKSLSKNDKSICSQTFSDACIDNSSENVISESTDNKVTNSSSNKKGKININTASLSELTSISGIGNVKASSIIEYREKNGKFKTIEDITKVSGIGQATYKKIKDYITV